MTYIPVRKLGVTRQLPRRHLVDPENYCVPWNLQQHCVGRQNLRQLRQEAAGITRIENLIFQTIPCSCLLLPLFLSAIFVSRVLAWLESAMPPSLAEGKIMEYARRAC